MSPNAPSKARVPAVDGWFVPDDTSAALLGGRCRGCGTYSFPRAALACPNPACRSGPAEEVRLSRTGRVWSYTDAAYKPPPPYVASDPFEPFAIAAVELEEEKLVVLGQVVPGVSASELYVGCEMELVTSTLYEDETNVYLVWKWKPLDRETSTPSGGRERR